RQAKKELCQLAQNNPNFTQQELAGKFEIGRSTVADILAKLSYWLSLDDESTAAQQKRNRLPNHPQLEEILACWFDLALENHITITDLILQEKAKQIANALDIQNFAVSDDLKNPENPEHLNISIHEFIEIDNKYATGKMPTINKLIEEMQESEPEEEGLEKQKPVMPT
ncbi:22413_t:CDS:2, partial [Racocetra persica]